MPEFSIPFLDLNHKRDCTLYTPDLFQHPLLRLSPEKIGVQELFNNYMMADRHGEYSIPCLIPTSPIDYTIDCGNSKTLGWICFECHQSSKWHWSTQLEPIERMRFPVEDIIKQARSEQISRHECVNRRLPNYAAVLSVYEDGYFQKDEEHLLSESKDKVEHWVAIWDEEGSKMRTPPPKHVFKVPSPEGSEAVLLQQPGNGAEEFTSFWGDEEEPRGPWEDFYRMAAPAFSRPRSTHSTRSWTSYKGSPRLKKFQSHSRRSWASCKGSPRRNSSQHGQSQSSSVYSHK
jgi:hypothetical protein